MEHGFVDRKLTLAYYNQGNTAQKERSNVIGIGTIINSAAIICGGAIGLLGGRFMKPRYQETIQRTCGVCVLFKMCIRDRTQRCIYYIEHLYRCNKGIKKVRV